MYDAILVPTDGRPNTERAIDEAIGLALAHDATLHAVYVVNSQAIAPGIDFADLERIGEDAVEHVATLAREAGVADVRTVVTHGLRERAIREYADAHDVDLIVVGRQPRIGRFLRPGLSDRLSSDAEVPVLVVS